ncbi:hypothetical protein TCAL_05287 [Tigriopus californicus]|uniref:PAX-interacting protein 1 n=1 Tax=Tigriopus californicus TaxID=6832 RepID=A0A553NX68_TIGCA|nr:hypothetical protein TCAL_05287 [Tigriopus californicus]
MSDPGPQPQPPPAATPTSTTSTTPAPWFADWKFFVSGQIQETVLSILEKGGAVQKSYLTPGVTHCLVGGEADLDGEVSEAADIYEIPVLSQDYVLDTHRTGRWPPQPPYNPLTAGQVLGACRLCLSGLGPEDSRSLWALIRAHGGQVVRELNAKVTHLIARDGLGPKYAAAARHGIPVVTPDWVLDGIRAGQLRDPAVYHPRLLLLPGQVPPPVKKMRKKRVPTVVAPPPPPIPPVSRVPRPGQLQWQQQGQGFPPGQGGPMPGQQVIRVPHSSPNASIMSPGAGPNNRMPVPQSVAGQPRPTWSGETHPALAQVPRTPQQLQHLQRLQMQREQQQQMDQTGAMISGPPGPRPAMGPQAIMGQPQVQMGGVPISQQQQQQAQFLQQQAAMQNGSNQKTKVALANMINNRLGQPPTSGGMPMGSPQGMSPQQPMPNQAPNPMGGPPMSGPMGPDGSAAARLQMMNQQLHPHQGGPHPHMIQPGTMYRAPGAPPQGPRFMSMQQQQQQRMEMAGHPVGHVMGPGVPPRFPGARMGMPPQPQQQQPPQQQQQPQPQQRPMAPGQPQGPRIQFHGHDPNTRLPPDLCLLGCIFYIIDYTEDPDKAKYVPDWKKVIKQFGGEVEEEYHPRLTHILCMTQDNPIVQQAVREGKRLVTTYWLNDTVVRKKVGPPWKAIHFPLPPNFTPPCENMILTLTGFVDRNRDWVKDMIAMTGAKYTSYFSRHNHVIVCQSATGEKYNKSKEWNVPAVSVQWLNDVLFGNGNAEQCMQNPKYHNFKMEDPFRMDYTLVPHLIAAWKNPIRVTPETYNKFKANPPARIKRKAERQRLEKEEAKRLREAEEMRGGMPPNQGYPGQMMPNGMGAQQHQNPMMMQQQQQHHQQQQQMSMGGVPPQMDPNGFNRDQNHSGPGQQSANPGNPQSGEPSKTGEDLNPNALTDKQSKQPIKAEGNETSENKENDASNKFKVVLTGFGPTENDELKALVRELGGQVLMSQHAQMASHLVMHHLGRSVTFFCALPHGRVFYLTPSIKPAMQKVQWIIEASGGVVENRRRRDIAQIKEANPPDKDPSYIIICCEHDLHLVADVLKAKLWIFNVELVLSSVIRQQLDFDPSKYLTTTPVTSST